MRWVVGLVAQCPSASTAGCSAAFLTIAVTILALGILAAPLAVEGQPATNAPRIGHLAFGSASTTSSSLAAFRERLHEQGYVEGRNLLVEYRWAEDKADRLPALAGELVALEVKAIVAVGRRPLQAAMAATSSNRPKAWKTPCGGGRTRGRRAPTPALAGTRGR